MNSNDILKKRFLELSDRAFEKNYTVFSEFLNIDEISVLKSLEIICTLFGGYDGAERCVARFGDGDDSFPIVCIKIEPLQQKFADKLSHRDFLGSLMNLGINRNTLGDIVINENIGYLFCLESISEYIVDNLSRIKHTSVKCSVINEIPEFLTREIEPSEIIISSQRTDAVVASVYRLSRNNTSLLFKQEKVFVNSRLCTKESYLLKDGDIVSVRGYGKFIFDGVIRETKKQRLVAQIRIYK